MKTRQPKQITDYRHTTPAVDETPDAQPGNYYCSVFDPSDNAGNGRLGLILGPFTTHAEALRMKPAAISKAHDVCRDSIWYSFGTVRMRDDYTTPGVLNKFFPECFAACRDIATA